MNTVAGPRHQPGEAPGERAGQPASTSASAAALGGSLDRERAKALLHLRGLDTHAITRATGVRLQNYVSWMNGNDEALSERNKALIAEIIGYSGAGLDSKRVHVWNIDGRSSATRARGLEALAVMEDCLNGATMRTFEPRTRTLRENLSGRVVAQALMKEGEFSVLILYRNRPLGDACVGDADMKGVVWYDKSRVGSAATVPQEFRASVLSGNITAKEFEKLYMDGQNMKTWGHAIMVLREMDVTPDEVINLATKGLLTAACAQAKRRDNVVTMGGPK